MCRRILDSGFLVCYVTVVFPVCLLSVFRRVGEPHHSEKPPVSFCLLLISSYHLWADSLCC